MTTVNAPSPHETTHHHHAPAVTRPRPRVDLATQLGAAAAVVARNRLHPFSAAAAADDDVGGRAIVLRIRLLHARVVTIHVSFKCAVDVCGRACWR